MSTKSKQNKTKNEIISLMTTLINSDMYHPNLVESTNRKLNLLIHQKLTKSSRNKNLYEQIKTSTDKLAILAYAATTQPIIVRTMSHKQFEIIQKELKQLKAKLQHSK